MECFTGIAEGAKLNMGCFEEKPKAGKGKDQYGSGRTSHGKPKRRGIKGAGNM